MPTRVSSAHKIQQCSDNANFYATVQPSLSLISSQLFPVSSSSSIFPMHGPLIRTNANERLLSEQLREVQLFAAKGGEIERRMNGWRTRTHPPPKQLIIPLIPIARKLHGINLSISKIPISRAVRDNDNRKFNFKGLPCQNTCNNLLQNLGSCYVS